MEIIGALTRLAANVNKFHQLCAAAVITARDAWKNEQTGEVWSVDIDITPAADGSYFLYIGNLTAKGIYKITDVRIEGAGAGHAEVVEVTGDSVAGGTAVVPKSRNLQKATKLPSTVVKVEDGAGLTAINDVGKPLFRVYTQGANQDGHLRTTSNVLVGVGTALALKWVGTPVALKGTLSITANGDGDG